MTENPPDQGSRAGKVSRYLGYALGEIVLVVIGILIALQINNWNEHRKDLQKEQLILQNLQKNLTFNLQELNVTLEATLNGYNNIKSYLLETIGLLEKEIQKAG